MVLKTARSFRYAFRGIWLVARYENNARVHMLASVLAVCAGLICGLSRDEWLWTVAAIALVWVCETFNTAFEKLVDLVSPDFNPKAGAVKDLSAGAVLIAAMFAFTTGMLIFLPKLIQLLPFFS